MVFIGVRRPLDFRPCVLHPRVGTLMIIFIDGFQDGNTITDEYYTSLLDRFKEKIKSKRPHLEKKHQDNAPSYKSTIAMA